MNLQKTQKTKAISVYGKNSTYSWMTERMEDDTDISITFHVELGNEDSNFKDVILTKEQAKDLIDKLNMVLSGDKIYICA